jgi:uncharacterized protein (TIGR02001 family)
MPSPSPWLMLSAGLISASLAWVVAARAQDAPGDAAIPYSPPPNSVPSSVAAAAKPSFAFTAGAASDYVFRGFSRSADRAQGFASVDAAYSDFYAGVWGSNAAYRRPNGPARTGAEVDVYAGWRPEFRGYSLDFGAQYDVFAGQPSGAGLDYAELYAKVSRSIGPATGRLGLHYSPAFTAHGGQAAYAEAGVDYAITRDWTASVGVGRQWVARQGPFGAADHLSWTAAIGHSFGEHLAVDLRYSDTDRHRLGDAYGGKLVGELRATF